MRTLTSVPALAAGIKAGAATMAAAAPRTRTNFLITGLLQKTASKDCGLAPAIRGPGTWAKERRNRPFAVVCINVEARNLFRRQIARRSRAIHLQLTASCPKGSLNQSDLLAPPRRKAMFDFNDLFQW